jgi:hypothetical protein
MTPRPCAQLRISSNYRNSNYNATQHNTMDSDSDDSDLEVRRPSNYNWVIPLLLLAVVHRRRPRIAPNRLSTAQGYVQNLLNCGSPTRIHNVLRMRLNTFYLLRDWLLENTELKSSRCVTIEEKLCIFIWISSSQVSNRKTQEHFNRSANTIFK